MKRNVTFYPIVVAAAVSAAIVLTFAGGIPPVGGSTTASQQNPTRAELLQTVKHIQSLAHDLQSALDQEKAAHAAVDKSLGEAKAHSDELQGLINKLAAHDAKVSDELNAANKKLWWYRLHWWGAWIIFALGVIACIVLAFLKLTGRLAIFGTAVASKIP